MSFILDWFLCDDSGRAMYAWHDSVMIRELRTQRWNDPFTGCFREIWTQKVQYILCQVDELLSFRTLDLLSRLSSEVFPPEQIKQVLHVEIFPIGSIYGIFTYIWMIFFGECRQRKKHMYMDPMGYSDTSN